MRFDRIELELAARRNRAHVIAELIGTGFAWLISRRPRLAHAARIAAV